MSLLKKLDSSSWALLGQVRRYVVGIHGGVIGAVSGDDDFLDEPDDETGGDDGVGWMGQVICIYPCVPL